MPNRKPFIFQKESSAFMQSLAKDLNDRLKKEQSLFISVSNMQSFNHGMRWQSHNSSNPDDISNLKTVKNQITIEKSDLLAYNVDVIERTIMNMCDSMSTAFMREMYATLSQACDTSGQTVDARGKGLAESFIEMLEKLEFSVDQDGNPQMPSIHVGTGGFKELMNDPKFKDPDFEAKVEEITQRKKAEALERERDRIAKFRVNNGS
jgi:hypothetical protein